MSLENQIIAEIRHNGPMSVARFMGLAVQHYYNSRDPFGAGGDFTTAPEISQMFGELLGAWAADCWMQMGRPARFILAECGPGRGTLMDDALRATKAVPGFHDAAQICLIEMSAVLKEKQRQALQGYEVFWHERLEDVPGGAPLILLANEFLDALPVRQFQYVDAQWRERVVGLDDSGVLCFGLAPLSDLAPELAGKEGDIVELSPARDSFVQAVCSRLYQSGGAALFIDYGYAGGHGDTLQALKKHKFVDVLADVGHADLTAHVDFAALERAAAGVKVFGPAGQGVFLQRLGIGPRAAMLQKNAGPAQARDIEVALRRLTAADEMGTLFKAMAFVQGDWQPAGF